jgi:ABC-type Na+ efflux pump permease subunit
VLWREWHRTRPSRLARIVWGAYFALALAGTAWGIVEFVDQPQRASEFLVFVNGFQATFGLLLLSLAAPTVLAEERVRGSLDVLLTTPLSTDRIVLAKWWGAFRVVPALALLPAIGCLFLAIEMTDDFLGIRRFGQVPAPLDVLDRVAYVVLPVGLLLAQGAAVTSVGLALATWTYRIGRAVAMSVTAYALVAFIAPIMVEIIPQILVQLGMYSNIEAAEFAISVVAGACPIFGQIVTFTTCTWPPAQSRGAFYIAQVVVLLATIAFALVVLAMAMATFNRCVGRASERARRAPRPPRRLLERRGPHAQSGVAAPALGSSV